MSPWLLLLLVPPLALLGRWIVSQRSRRHWQRLEDVLDALGEGREPLSYVFLHGGRFARLTEKLEKVAREQDRLRRVAEDEKFNLRAILASMQEGVMVVDGRHVLRLVNLAFLQLFGLRSSPLGQTVLHTLREATFEEMVDAALRTSEAQADEVTLRGSRPSRTFAVQAVPMRNGTGQPFVLTTFRDISRLRQLEEVRREFVANVSHELRTPLAIFRGYVETLLDHPELPPEQHRAIFEILEKHSQRLHAILQDLLILARLESRQDGLELEPTDLEECIRSIVSDWEKQAAAKQIQILAEFTPNLPRLKTHPLRFGQVLNNLLENALKFTPARGQITIRAAQHGEVIELRVEDTGIGIAPADLPHIFERFYRADKARSREHGGTGLGLSIVKHIMQMHGGSVHAESSFGKGTAIILRLPICGGEEVEAEPLAW